MKKVDKITLFQLHLKPKTRISGFTILSKLLSHQSHQSHHITSAFISFMSLNWAVGCDRGAVWLWRSLADNAAANTFLLAAYARLGRSDASAGAGQRRVLGFDAVSCKQLSCQKKGESKNSACCCLLIEEEVRSKPARKIRKISDIHSM